MHGRNLRRILAVVSTLLLGPCTQTHSGGDGRKHCRSSSNSKSTKNRSGRHVCYWHLADLRVAVSDVRFWGKAEIAISQVHVRF